MAGIDLGRYDVSIGKGVPIADIASDPNAGAYRALSQLGGDVADFANRAYQKDMETQRKATAWKAYSEYTQGMEKTKLDAQSRWDKLGNVDGEPYSTLMAKTSEKSAAALANNIEDADAREMFIRQVRPDALVSNTHSFAETQQRKIQAAPAYYLDQAKKFSSEAIDIDSPESTDFLVNKLDNTMRESNDVVGSFDQDMKAKTSKAILETGGEALAEKYTNLHLAGGSSTAKILSDFTGVNILFDSTQRRYIVDFLKSNNQASNQEREQILNDFMASTAPKLYALVQNGQIATNTPVNKIGGVSPKIEADGSISMDVMGVDGAFVERVKLPDVVDPSFGRVENASTKYFNALSADKKIAFYKNILNAKFKKNDNANKEYKQHINDLIAAPGVDWMGRKGSDLNMAYIIPRARELFNDMAMRESSKTTNVDLVRATAELTKNAIREKVSDDLVSNGAFIEYNDEQVKAEMYKVAGQIFSKDDPVWSEFKRPEAAGMIFKSLNEEVKKQQRTLRSEFAKGDPVDFINKYGNSHYRKIFDKGVDVDGNINQNILSQQKGLLDKMTRSYGIAGSKSDSIIFKSSVDNFTLALERAQASGPQEVQRVMNNIAKVDPVLRGRFVKEMVKGKALSENGEASTLSYAFLGGGPKDVLSQMHTAELMDLNTKTSRENGYKNFTSVFGQDAGKFTKTIDKKFNDIVQDKLPALFNDASKESLPILKALKAPIMASVMNKATLGMDDSALEDLMQQEFDKHISNRVSSVNTANIRGVFPKVADTGTLENEAEGHAAKVKADILAGKTKIDYSQYPELNATLLGRKSGKSGFMQANTKEEQFLKTYEVSYEGIDPFGGSGKLRMMIRGKGGKTAPLKILDNNNKSVDYPVDWAVK